MNDTIGYSLVALAAVLGAYACYLFETKVKDGVVHSILDWLV